MKKIKRERAEELIKNTCCVRIEENKLYIDREIQDKNTKEIYKRGDVLEIIDTKKKEKNS